MLVGRVRKRLNIESSVSPINEPLSNVYEKPIKSALDAMRKEKRKFPLRAFGNNVDSPDYFLIGNLFLNKQTVDHKHDYTCNRKHIRDSNALNLFDIPLSMSQALKSKHTYLFNTNTETTHFIEPKYTFIDTSIEGSSHRLLSNPNRLPRDYDILSNNQRKSTKVFTSHGAYFSRLAALNVFIKDNDTKKMGKKSNKRSDGIYEYLKRNNYV